MAFPQLLDDLRHIILRFSDNMIEVKRTHEATDNRYNDIFPTQVIDIYLKSVRYNGRDHC